LAVQFKQFLRSSRNRKGFSTIPMLLVLARPPCVHTSGARIPRIPPNTTEYPTQSGANTLRIRQPEPGLQGGPLTCKAAHSTRIQFSSVCAVCRRVAVATSGHPAAILHTEPYEQHICTRTHGGTPVPICDAICRNPATASMREKNLAL